MASFAGLTRGLRQQRNPQSGDQTVAAALTSEVARAQASEAVVAGAVTSETSRAQTAEALLFPRSWSFPTETTEKVQWSWVPPSRAPFKAISWGSANTDLTTTDHWAGFGFNADVFVDRTQGVAGEPAWFMGFEDGWYDGAHQGSEWYVAYYSPDHATANSVPLFRPFYTRVLRDNNTQHSATTYCDIGTTDAGTFNVSSGDFAAIFTVAANVITWRPRSGNGTFILDAAGASTPNLQFRNAGSNGFVFQSTSVTQLVLNDKDGRAQATWIQGANSAAALVHYFSGVTVDGPFSAGSTSSFTGLLTVNANVQMAASAGAIYGAGASSPVLSFDTNKLSFFNATPAAKPTITGSKGANAALTSLLSALATMGLLTDSST